MTIDERLCECGSQPEIEENFNRILELIDSGGGGGEGIQKSTMPEASEANVGKIYQYVGETSEDYTNGYWYECVLDDETYKWQEIYTQPNPDLSNYLQKESTNITIYTPSDTQTLQDVLDAAGEVYQETGERQNVIVLGEVELKYNSVEGVDVVSKTYDTGYEGGNVRAVDEAHLEDFPVQTSGSLIAIAADDGIAAWLDASLDTDNVFGGLSPQEYFHRKGIPITHAINANTVGTQGFFTWEQVKRLFWEYGCEITNHSISHSHEPENYKEALNAILGGKEMLENHTENDFTSPDKKIGCRVFGFNEPGGWQTELGLINSMERADNSLTAALIRKTHQYSRAFACQPYMMGNVTNRYFLGTIALEHVPATFEGAVSFLKLFATQKMRFGIGCHNPYSPDFPSNAAVRLKCLADAIEYLRDVEGIIQPANMYNVVLGRQVSYDRPLVQFSFDSFEENQNLSSFNSNGLNVPFQFIAGTDGTITCKKDENGAKYLQLVKAGTGNPYAYFKAHLTRGRCYEFKARVKSAINSTLNSNKVVVQPRVTGSQETDLITSNAYHYFFPTLNAGEEGTIRMLFSVPTWSNGMTSIMLRIISSNNTLDIYDVQINPI